MHIVTLKVGDILVRVVIFRTQEHLRDIVVLHLRFSGLAKARPSSHHRRHHKEGGKKREKRRHLMRLRSQSCSASPAQDFLPASRNPNANPKSKSNMQKTNKFFFIFRLKNDLSEVLERINVS